ncbi:hypothetical protein [Psychrobacillus sp. MER TA 171]|uniref:hypothetical protein n=1 Tax=Psychrobacillus sp. MER TA 171 TaxID=2939577 RepID=UPI00203FC73E|nr:hypothetical protein [Psychrobacillus sp. MER TA 171]MCM3356490.1 hypothetical protein [Psychrobacillus sp. MER TA 171]
MKKKAIKIAASTAVAASAFVAAAPAAQQADAATNVNQLITDAQNAGTVLKWAISVEGSANFVDRPYDHYNAAKKAIANAEKAAAKLSGSEKLSTDAKLVEPKLQVKRAGAYIDAITSSEKIKTLTAGLDSAIKTNDIEKVEAAYHTATAEYRKQAALLDRVYGQSTRDEIRNKVKPSIEKLVADVKNEVTVNMLAKAADTDLKANKFADASKKIAEAQAILDANVLKWETALQKSVDDVKTALPLSVSTVSVLNDTTLVVTLSKPVVAVAASEFTFDKGLVATSAVLSSDKKTVTLTTNKQAAGTEYTVAYKGSSAKFTTVAAPIGNVTLDTAASHAETTQSIALVASFKTPQGTANNNPVNVTVPTGYKVISVNGSTASTIASGTTEMISPVNGQIVLVVAANSTTTPAVGGKIKFETLTGSNGSVVESKSSGSLNFYLLDDAEVFTTTTGVVEYVDAANNYFVANSGNKYLLKASGNVYQDKDSNIITLDTLKSKLSKGDVVTGQYIKDGSSVLKLELDRVETADFEVDQELVTGTPAFRVAGNTITLTGSGEVGREVSVYDTSKARPVAKTTVLANGKWTATVPVDPTTGVPVNFSARQATSVNEIAPDYSTTGAGFTAPLPVLAAAFETNGAAPDKVLSGTTADESLNGDVVTYTVKTIDTVVIKAGATITLQDGDSTRATYTHGVNGTKIEKVSGAGNEGKFAITFGAPSSISGGDNKLTGSLSVHAVTGIENQYGLKLSTNGMVNIFGY